MKIKYLFVASFAVLLLCDCESKAERTVNDLKDLREQYINDIDNAQTKEDAIKIRKELKDREKFEVNKLSDEEIKEYERNLSWEEAQKIKELNDRTEAAENRARERFRNQ